MKNSYEQYSDSPSAKVLLMASPGVIEIERGKEEIERGSISFVNP
jgi:hypothetical protein